MSEYSLKEYYEKLLKEAINAMPKSINPLPREHDYQKSKVSPGVKSIPVGKSLDSAHFRVEQSLNYLKDQSKIPKEIILNYNKQRTTIQLSQNYIDKLIEIYTKYDNYFKLRKRTTPNSGNYSRPWNYQRSLANLDTQRKALKNSYHDVLKKIYEDHNTNVTYLRSNLSYVGFPGFDKIASDSERYEAETVNNAVDVLSNIKNLSGSLIVSLHTLIKNKLVPNSKYASVNDFYDDIKLLIRKNNPHLYPQNTQSVTYIQLVDEIYDELDGIINNVDNQFNVLFKKQIDRYQTNPEISGFAIPFKKEAIPQKYKSQLTYNGDDNLKTAIGFLIINSSKSISDAGIASNLENTPYTDRISTRDVKASAGNRSDLDFDFLTFKTKLDQNGERQLDFNSEAGKSLKIELKDGLAKGGSGTFWIAFEKQAYDNYMKDLMQKTSVKPLKPLHSRYIFKGTQSKELFPQNSTSTSQNSVYTVTQNSVNSYFDTMFNSTPDKCIPLHTILANLNVFTGPYNNTTYNYNGNEYYLYYMGQSNNPAIRLYNELFKLNTASTNWLKSYYFTGKNNEYINIKGKGLYLLNDPANFKNKESQDLGRICQSELNVSIVPDNDLEGISIMLAGSRTGCKWEVLLNKKLQASNCQEGFEDQEVLSNFLLLATLCFNGQSNKINDPSLYQFMINNFKKVFSSAYNIPSLYNASYVPKGNLLREVYSYLYEGGLGGHMRHPYENLDVTPREMMDRIESYGVPQTVIDKVDGQNLFFTVDRDGTLLFARNKQDMTHQDLVNKFTGHGAEAAFLEGGEAIKRGVEQWLGSAGNFADQEVLDIFHPTEDIRSFINFEIMHPKNSNQIQYDKKYIVFHSIIDFGEGRSKIFSSNQDDRLKKLISLMNAGVSSTGFELASNREIDLNTLSNVQIMVYTDRVRELIEALGMKEDEFLADGILRIIDEELSQEGVNLEENTLKIMRDFVLYGEDGAGDAITSRDFTKHISKEDTKTLRVLGLTSATKAKAKVAKILSPFKEIFVDLGIDLLKGVDSAYLSPEQSKENITGLRDKLQTAIEDYDQYIMSTPEDELSKIALRLKPHVDKIKQVGIDKAVSTSVEGGVYTQDLDLEKITGGFAPLNQIVGAAYRDKEGIFPNFQDKFSMNENKRYSLKSVFNLDD